MPSVWPPAGYGTMMRIWRAGHADCALVLAGRAVNVAAPVTNVRRVSLVIVPPVDPVTQVPQRRCGARPGRACNNSCQPINGNYGFACPAAAVALAMYFE